ncbi:hypothetical protein [Deinococcus frigens]|uniref:hypothetical protein n=1 Tax=Deinococcus frigens TaxID=249403 RepID=UPI0004971963|nr:hypothetical protein [Deinococcus frigens]
MTRRIKPSPRPRYEQNYPEHLATGGELRALGLRPGTSEPDGILEYQHGDRSGICALYERSKALPIASPVQQP